MMVDITVDTEALVVDAYPMMRETENTGVFADDFDIAWGFYCAMAKQSPELVGAYRDRMKEMVKAVRDIEQAAGIYKQPWFTQAELEEEQSIMRDAAMRGYKPPRSMELMNEIMSRKTNPLPPESVVFDNKGERNDEV